MFLRNRMILLGGTLAVMGALICGAAHGASAQCSQPCKPPFPDPLIVSITGTQNGYSYSTYSPGGGNTGNTNAGGSYLGSPRASLPSPSRHRLSTRSCRSRSGWWPRTRCLATTGPAESTGER
jgi:hypothetical protein